MMNQFSLFSFQYSGTDGCTILDLVLNLAKARGERSGVETANVTPSPTGAQPSGAHTHDITVLLLCIQLAGLLLLPGIISF